MITRYVNTASTAGGDGTTNAPIGANRAWATLQEAEEALRLIGVSEDIEVLCCGSVANEGQVFFDTTYQASGYTLYIKGNRDDPNGYHGGKLNTSTFRVRASNHAIFVSIPSARNIVFDGIQMIVHTSNALACFYANEDMGAKSAILNCILHAETNSSHAIWTDAICEELRVENNVMVGNGSGNYGLRVNGGSNSVLHAYNNIITGFAYGIAGTGATWTTTAKNNAVFGNTDDFFTNAGTLTIDHCASDDGDGTNPVAVSNWASQFYNANYLTDLDFRLNQTSVLLDAGVGPGVDANVPTTDILEYARSGSTATVGPFEHEWDWVFELPAILSAPRSINLATGGIDHRYSRPVSMLLATGGFNGDPGTTIVSSST